jgi:hypothetical protein
MKVSLFLLGTAASIATQASARQIANKGHVRKLLDDAAARRRLADDDGDGDGDGDDGNDYNDFLVDYSFKLIHCAGDETSQDEDGNVQYGMVILRACPKSSCRNGKQGGCTSGYADFSLPLADFAYAYMEDQAESNNWGDDQMNFVNFAQCAEYEEATDDDGGGDDQGSGYYVGPTCTSNGKDIQLQLFEDAYCSQVADNMSLEKLSANGSTNLPFNEDGIVSGQCMSCADKSDDDGSYYVKDMCSTVFDEATARCEKKWDVQHYYWDTKTEVNRYGKDTSGCKTLSSMNKSENSASKSARAILPILLLGLVIGAAICLLVWLERKEAQKEAAETEAGGSYVRWGRGGRFGRGRRAKAQESKQMNGGVYS